jgi:xanthine dehydrogenase molybdopterin-binding subunit B
LSACAHTWKGTVRMSGQRHFYMETQRAIVRPTENNGIHIRSSTQGPTVVAKYVAKACGLLTHNVVCEQVRAGGGFGGKLTRNLPIGKYFFLSCWGSIRVGVAFVLV